MTELDTALEGLRAHEGVEHLILLGRDGLVVRHAGSGSADEETIAARVPGLAAACEALGRAAGAQGRFSTAVIEFDHGVAVVASLSSDLLLSIQIRPGVGFATLLRRLRQDRLRLIELL
jgi:predicted regulator of Ras-like GTPase activity (Roadblock/LC7/MglB family)